LPPLDRVIAFPRTKGHVRAVADYEVFFEALGFDVHSERLVLGYPWAKVREPTPGELATADVLVRQHGADLRAFRFVDLELDLRERDAARGRRRPVPERFADWSAVKAAHDGALATLAPLGLRPADLRPAGAAPYPPQQAREPTRAD
jgi:hypothetical protein